MIPLADFSKSPFSKIRPISIEKIEMKNGLLANRQRAIFEKGIWHGLKMLKETGSVEAFDIASGKSNAPLRGFVYRDSDLYKWLEAAAYALALNPDSKLEREVDEIIEKIANAQDSDGYVNTSFAGENKCKRFSNLAKDHEIYCAGHLIQAAVAHHRATGKSNLLEIAKRFAQHLYEVFGPSGRLGTCGHPVIEMAMVELYRETADEKWLTMAKRFLDARGHNVAGGTEYFVDHLPFRQQKKAVGHAVRALYLYAGATDIFLETGEDALKETVLALWEDLQNGKTYVTGGVGARHEGEAIGEPHELPNLRAYAETCAAIASMQFNWRLFAMSAHPRCLDALETALYNGFLAGVSWDGTRYFYVNPLESSGNHERQPWYDCACCPPNIYRTLASIQGVFFAKDDEGIFVNFFEPCILRDEDYSLEIEANYPWGEEVAIKIMKSKEFTLRLRIPEWCKTLAINGERISRNGFFEIRREWKKGDTVKLHMEMPVHRVFAHPRMRENRNCISLMRGPIVYCFESAHNKSLPVRDISITNDEKPKTISFGDFDGITALEVPVLDGKNLSNAPSYAYDEYPKFERVKTMATAIPYMTWANRGASEMLVWIPLAEK